MIRASQLPPLTGTEKQVRWANDIRLQYLSQCVGTMAELERVTTRERFNEVQAAHAEVVKFHRDAEWWITRRVVLGDVIPSEMEIFLVRMKYRIPEIGERVIAGGKEGRVYCQSFTSGGGYDKMPIGIEVEYDDGTRASFDYEHGMSYVRVAQ